MTLAVLFAVAASLSACAGKTFNNPFRLLADRPGATTAMAPEPAQPAAEATGAVDPLVRRQRLWDRIGVVS